MVSLGLQDCQKCMLLPTLGGLTSLEVCMLGKVKSIDDESYGECMNPFASLKEL